VYAVTKVYAVTVDPQGTPHRAGPAAGRKRARSGQATNGDPTARAGSVGSFFEQASAFFGDPDVTLPGKGERLARLVQQERCLLVLDGLQPLYQAARHGCIAGRRQEACDKVYVERILRGTGLEGNYSTFKLGAISTDLGAVAAFFDEPCGRVSPHRTEPDRAWLLHEAGLLLRALGRLTEAVEPMRAALDMAVQQEARQQAAVGASNLSELEVTLGRLPAAIADASDEVAHADASDDAFPRMAFRITLADALHQTATTPVERDAAGAVFAEAEQMQRERQPQFPRLYSLQGFQYCDWLLPPAEPAAPRRGLADRRARPDAAVPAANTRI
jgi:hypothetical protein